MRSPLVLAAAALVAIAAAPLPTSGQEGFGQCGSIALVFVNPDLRPRDDDKLVHASGAFFIQFQAVGAEASKVSKISFGFGALIPDALVNCAMPVGEPLTGAEFPKYRNDADGKDGFFVPINTTFVPDNQYSASITAYDSSGNYLARFFTKAVVENGPNCFPSRQKCDDRVMPWPMILPGDGNQTNSVGGLTIEYAEPVQDVLVKINGEQVNMEFWTPPGRDDDARPDNDHDDCGPFQELPNPPSPCHRVIWGTGFRLNRELKAGDVIEATAIDNSGNPGTKIVTVGGSTQGGTIELQEPEVRLSADALEQDVEAGNSAEYNVKLVNVGQGDAEVRLTVDAPSSMTAQWSEPTATIATGGEKIVKLNVTPARDTKPGGYTLQAKATYKSGTIDRESKLPLVLRVTEYRPVPESPLRQARANATAQPQEEEAKKSPGAEVALGVGILALVAVAERRRRG